MTTTAVPCTSVASIAGFTPGTGPTGTIVTITGSGFTGVTGVKFGSLNATTFTIVNDNTITARTPANTPTDKITLVVGTCNAVSASSFISLFQSGTCGSTSSSSVTELFISEVYDALVGSLSYVEIFNGTTGGIDLSNYAIRFKTGTSTINDYPLSNVNLASGATYILSVGSTTAAT